MSRRCAICGKKSIVATVRKKLRATKYNPTTKKRKHPNLQWVILESGKRVKACTKCIRTLSKTKTNKTRSQRLKERLELKQAKKEKQKSPKKEIKKPKETKKPKAKKRGVA